jgi:hypothetical protein
MITDETVEDAVDRLQDPEKAARAYGYKIQAEKMLSVVKALEMKKHQELPVSAQEREAYISPEYKKHLDILVNCEVLWQKKRMQVEADKALLDVYRTQQANMRGNI